MPRPRKLFIHGTVVSISTRVQEGLPFVPTRYMKLIIQSALAGAQKLYKARIVAYLVMGNHIHLILVVDNPEDIPRFMRYFKRETSGAINRLLGRRQRSVWVPGYNSPVILDAEKAIQEIVYLYTNPQKARLVNRIEDYPQLSSWNELFSCSSTSSLVPSFRRDAIPALGENHSQEHDEKVYEEILSKSKDRNLLRIEPHAWMECFEETRKMKPFAMRNLIEKRVRAKEQEFRMKRGPEVLGRENLLRQDIRVGFHPKKWGKKMLCLATEKLKRIPFLQWYKDQIRNIERSMEAFRLNLTPPKLPPGFFLPGGRLTASLLPFVLEL